MSTVCQENIAFLDICVGKINILIILNFYLEIKMQAKF